MRLLTAFFLLVFVLMAAACGDEDKGGIVIATGSPTAAAPGPARTTVISPSPAPVGLDALSLVYVDTRAGTPQLFVSRADGTAPRKVVDLQRGTRLLDVRNAVALVGGGEDSLATIDLRNGRTVDLRPAGNVGDARFVDDNAVLYVTQGTCAGPSPANATAQLLNLREGTRRELLSSRGNTITVAGVGRDGKLALAPRGCDVAVSEVVYFADARSGAATSKTETRGCGWVAAAPDTMDALVSWLACTRRDDKRDVEATVYALLPASRAPRDFKAAPGGASNQQPWLLRPERSEAVYGTSVTTGTGPGSTRGGGLWTVDLRSGTVSALVPPAGSEQYGVRWTPDGRYLLAASVQAMGLCSYSIVDGNDKKVTPLPESISFCGAKGSVWGFTTIR